MIGSDHALKHRVSGNAAATHPTRHVAGSTLAWLLVYAALAFGFYGMRPLGEPDEGRYAEAAREMLATGDWLVPHIEGRVHLTKPPLTYWLSAAGMKLLGVNAWGARLFLAAAFFGTILCTAALARRWGMSIAQSRAAGLVFGSSLLPFTAGHILTTDMFLTFWMTLGVLCAWQVWRGRRNTARWRWGFYVAFGLAFFTKGPPGWIPLLVIVVFQAMKFSRRPRARLWSPAGLVVMLAIALWWYLLLSARDFMATGSWGVLRYFTIGEVYERVFTSEHKRDQSFLIYIYAIVGGILPWIFVWPEMIRSVWRSRFSKLRDPWRFALLWFAVPYVIFMLSKSRMYFYVLPLFVPLAIFTGAFLPAWFDRARVWPKRKRIALTASACVWALVLIAIASWPDWAPKNRSQRPLARQLQEQGPLAFKHLYSRDEPDLTLSFYLGLTMHEIDMNSSSVLLFLDYERRNGRPSALLIKHEDLKKIARDRTRIKILAESKEYAVIMPVERLAR